MVRIGRGYWANFTQYRVTCDYTKSGKSRRVPISEQLHKELIEEVPFVSRSAAFRKAIESAGIDLRKGRLSMCVAIFLRVTSS